MKIPINRSLLRKAVVPAVSLALMGSLFIPARSTLLPTYDEAGGPIASKFDFTAMPIALPKGLPTDRKIRELREPYKHLSAWISSRSRFVATTSKPSGVSRALASSIFPWFEVMKRIFMRSGPGP